ncbi:MAG: penicillin-binding protein activator LpoB [bacterium]
MRRSSVSSMAAAACLLALASGCGTTVEYGDPKAVETVTVDYGSTDLQMIAERMVQSMLASPAISDGNRPVLQVASVVNQTGEHIDTKALTDKIRTTLLKSGKVQFSASEVRQEVIDELEYQRSSGYVDPETRRQVGKQVGAAYLLTGDIASIRKSKDDTRDVYYKMTLNLVNLETGLISWADEKEIRKRQE